MNFEQTIVRKGIDERKAMANLRRRTTMRSRADRPKLYPADVTVPHILHWNRREHRQRELSLLALKTTKDTEEYVQAWCMLNFLKL
jgi:hypothetical protein